jgi:hypothetical protein
MFSLIAKAETLGRSVRVRTVLDAADKLLLVRVGQGLPLLGEVGEVLARELPEELHRRPDTRLCSHDTLLDLETHPAPSNPL